MRWRRVADTETLKALLELSKFAGVVLVYGGRGVYCATLREYRPAVCGIVEGLLRIDTSAGQGTWLLHAGGSLPSTRRLRSVFPSASHTFRLRLFHRHRNRRLCARPRPEALSRTAECCETYRPHIEPSPKFQVCRTFSVAFFNCVDQNVI